MSSSFTRPDAQPSRPYYSNHQTASGRLGRADIARGDLEIGQYSADAHSLRGLESGARLNQVVFRHGASRLTGNVHQPHRDPIPNRGRRDRSAQELLDQHRTARAASL